jgi:hypothetical protein
MNRPPEPKIALSGGPDEEHDDSEWDVDAAPPEEPYGYSTLSQEETSVTVSLDREPQAWVLRVAWAACAATWVGALLCTTIEIAVFPGTSFGKQETRSLLGTLGFLWSQGPLLAFALISAFSVLFPLLKLGLLGLLVVRPSLSEAALVRKCLRVLASTAAYQLLDVYVAVFLIGLLNNGAAEAKFGIGFYLFLCYCLMSMVVAQVLERTGLQPPGLRRYATQEGEEHVKTRGCCERSAFAWTMHT